MDWQLPKFVGSSAANVTLSVIKDKSFQKYSHLCLAIAKICVFEC